MTSPLNDNRIRIALYARVSSDEQREGHTIDSQIAELERFAKDREWLAAGTYCDEGWSGTLLGRPELDRLRDDATKGLFNAVLINDVDRLARDVTHLGIIKRHFERAGVRLIFRKLPSDGSPTHNLLVNVLGSFAEFEREMLIDRTRRGRRHKVEARQEFLGGIPPYGYTYVATDRSTGTGGRLEVNPAEAAVVKQMFAWVDEEGLSARGVRMRLNERGYRARKGQSWQSSSVMRMLHCRTYTGLWHYNKHEACVPQDASNRSAYERELKSSRRLRPQSEWLPVRLPAHLRLVSPERFERVQHQIQRNKAFSRRNSKHAYLLRGLVRCGGCGAAYVGQPSHGRFVYRCDKRCRRFRSIREELLDSVVWNAITEVLEHPEIVARHAERFRMNAESRQRAIHEERQTLAAHLREAEKEEGRLLDAYRRGIISATQLGEQLAPVNQRLTALRAQTANQSKGPTGMTGLQAASDVRRLVRDGVAALSFEKRQQLLRALIRRIVFRGDTATIEGVAPAAPVGQAKATAARVKAAVGTAHPTGSEPTTDSAAPAEAAEDVDFGLREFEITKTVPVLPRTSTKTWPQNSTTAGDSSSAAAA